MFVWDKVRSGITSEMKKKAAKDESTSLSDYRSPLLHIVIDTPQRATFRPVFGWPHLMPADGFSQLVTQSDWRASYYVCGIVISIQELVLSLIGSSIDMASPVPLELAYSAMSVTLALDFYPSGKLQA